MLEHSKQLDADRPPRTREQDTKRFSTDFRLPYSRVLKRPQKEHGNKNSILLKIRKVSRHISSNKLWIGKGPFRSSHPDCIRIGLTQSKKCLFDPNFFDRESDPRIPSKKSTFSTGCADRIARSNKFLSPPHHSPLQKTHDHTLQQLRCCLDCYCCCSCCSQRVSVAHPVLCPPAAHTVIPWQQCVLSITYLQHRCCCCARLGDSRRVPTPQRRR